MSKHAFTFPNNIMASFRSVGTCGNAKINRSLYWSNSKLFSAFERVLAIAYPF